MLPVYILSIIVVAGFGLLYWQQRQSRSEADPHLKAELDRRKEEMGELKTEIQQLKADKQELSSKGKDTFARMKDLEGDCKTLQKERDTLAAQAAKYEAESDRKQKRHEELIAQQEEARKALEDEKVRIRREDEAKQEQLLAERDRMWGEHETTVQSLLRDLCKRPQLAFATFDNTNLPAGFDGSLKPDFLIEFLDQYIIFDAKVTRSQSIRTYITDQVKKTARKIKGNPQIYPCVFLVIPTDAISELKEYSYVEGGFTFYVVSPESLEPILAALKRITTYELADQFDPQERENIIGWIAKLDNHISARNSFDVLLAEMGAELLGDTRALNPDLSKEVAQQREKMKVPALKPSEMKKLVGSMDARKEKIDELTAPKAAVQQRSLDVE